MRFTFAKFAGQAMLSLAWIANASAADARLEIELIADRSAPLTSQQEWLKVLADLGQQSIRIRGGRHGDTAGITKSGTDAAPVYRVVGIINSSGAVQFPGATFAVRDAARLRTWLDRLAKGNPDVNADKPVAFGLTSKEFSAVSQDLSRAVDFATLNASANDVVQRLAKKLQHPLVIDDAARRELATGEKVYDDLQGVSAGTALAAALRPSGLIVRPRKTRDRVELLVTASEGQKELWPLGWEPEQPPGRLIPQLAQHQTFEIEDTPLAQVLPAIAKQLKAPILLDHNALVRNDVDPAKVNVNLPREKLVYATGLQRILRPHLKYEVRVDEAGKPLLWITTIKR